MGPHLRLYVKYFVPRLNKSFLITVKASMLPAKLLFITPAFELMNQVYGCSFTFTLNNTIWATGIIWSVEAFYFFRPQDPKFEAFSLFLEYISVCPWEKIASSSSEFCILPLYFRLCSIFHITV